MNKPSFILVALIFVTGIAVAQEMTITLAEGKDTISRHIYGHFAEHLGRGIYGGFYVGEGNTKIPNTHGVRNDVVKALKELKIPNLRWPGGCFADTYQWKDGIGPKDKRPTIINQWWGGNTEDNSFGTNEFLNLCELLETEPYLSVNVGTGTVQDVIDWVQYTTYSSKSPMSDLRKQNGRENPWRVKYWGVGNEAWGCGGNMTPEYYANIYRQYATFIQGDKLFRIASGANEKDYHWTETLMKNIPKHLIEGVALHSYSVIDWNNKGSAVQFTEEQYLATMKKALIMEEYVQKHSDIMDKYDPENKTALIVDEWGGWYDVEPGTNPGFLYQQNTMRDAMIAGTTLNIFNNHCRRVKMANLAQAINVLQAVILTDEEKMLLTPTYHVLKMYAVHQDALLLPVTLENNKTTGKSNLPSISCSASRDKKGVVHISLVNIDPSQSNTVKINLGTIKTKAISGNVLTSAKLQDHNTFDNPNKILPGKFERFTTKGNHLEVEMPPFSVVVLELK